MAPTTLLTALALLCLTGCGETTTAPPADEHVPGCIAQPTVDFDALVEATERFCSTEGCAYDYSPSECRFFVPLDISSHALVAANPSACLQAQIEELDCLASSTGCRSAGCEDAAARAEERCPTADAISVVEPFPGATELCTRATECYASPDEPGFDQNVAWCLAEQAAELWAYAHQEAEPPCACELAALRRCFGGTDLVCDGSRARVDAACPDESGAFNRCTSGTICARLGGGGGPTSCTEDISCGGTVYEVSCDEGACSCTVGGEAGPAITATDCTDDAFRECGAPL